MVSVSSTKRLESSSTVHEILKGELLQHASEDDFIFHIKYINSKHNYCMFYDDQHPNEFQIEDCDGAKKKYIFQLESNP